MIWLIAIVVLAGFLWVLFTPHRRQQRAVRKPDPEMNGHSTNHTVRRGNRELR